MIAAYQSMTTTLSVANSCHNITIDDALTEGNAEQTLTNLHPLLCYEQSLIGMHEERSEHQWVHTLVLQNSDFPLTYLPDKPSATKTTSHTFLITSIISRMGLAPGFSRPRPKPTVFKAKANANARQVAFEAKTSGLNGQGQSH